MGIAGLAESGAPLVGDKAAGPVIAWHDGRGEEVAARLTHVFGDELALRIGQRPRSVSSVAKLGWLVENGLGALDGWLGVPELCLWLLTGERASDWSLTARTGAFDLGWRDWIPEVFEVAGIPEGVFPEPQPAGSVLGRVGRSGAARFGVRVGTPVTLAGHDHLAAAEALGAAPGTAFNSVGTAECVLGFERPAAGRRDGAEPETDGDPASGRHRFRRVRRGGSLRDRPVRPGHRSSAAPMPTSTTWRRTPTPGGPGTPNCARWRNGRPTRPTGSGCSSAAPNGSSRSAAAAAASRG